MIFGNQEADACGPFIEAQKRKWNAQFKKEFGWTGYDEPTPSMTASSVMKMNAHMLALIKKVEELQRENAQLRKELGK